MLENKQEKVFILQPVLDGYDESVLNEAIALVESSNSIYLGYVSQKIREINPATYIGTGKLEEIKDFIKDLGVDAVLFNGELTPSQTLNISAYLDDIKVFDKTTLILDIFAQRAKSAEGKLQVELAQLKYIYPRLKGRGIELSRLGGGIGTRGPGETQLETDRRHIKRRINLLENQLKELKTRRDLQATRRKKNDVKTVALVGYTNTGKSTLLNVLTDANAYSENKLFATLDTLSRKLTLNNFDVLITDTVGFIKDLPHNIVEAFKSTLESAVNSDLNLIVCDASQSYKEQLDVTLATLAEIKTNTPYILVLNKCDLAYDLIDYPDNAILVSAAKNINIDKLLAQIENHFSKSYILCDLHIPYTKIKEYMQLKSDIIEHKVDYLDDYVFVNATIPKKYIAKFNAHLHQ